ncbi:hypothetical protein K6V71_12470 [Cupriavidus gilardii]|uniref:DUF6716 putative glycosyltransferase n=1 Tax=Cupriavidus gilardii TaxID=82541 RepID=UPI0021B15E8F|nr:DUF6716 putative glycosyltransferase [Cupriavidus gilardii]UXC36802.1 hypothetical protein N4G38_04925 [Cupriavidus gilardii]
MVFPLAKHQDWDRLSAALQNSSIVVLSCGGRDINQILRRLDKYPSRPITVSVFPGIVVKDQFDALITRLRCDYVLLNSAADLSRYSALCRAIGLANNGLEYGASWYAPSTSVAQPVSQPQATAFFEQIDVPPAPHARRQLVSLLIRIAKKYPERDFYIKPRQSEMCFSRGSRRRRYWPLTDFLQEMDRPENLHVFDQDVEQLLARTDSCITVSSSAAIEYILAGKKAFIVSDFASVKNFSHYFCGSGLLRSFDDIDFDEPIWPDPRWVRHNVKYPDLPEAELRVLLKAEPGLIRRGMQFSFLHMAKLTLHLLPLLLSSPRAGARRLRRAINLINW